MMACESCDKLDYIDAACHDAVMKERDQLRAEMKRLREALRLCVDWMPKAEVRSWPPGFRLRDEALAVARAALQPGEEG